MRSYFACALALSACTPSLSRETIRNHPRIKIEVLEPQVVEASAPIRPQWILKPDRGAVAYVAFTGQSFAPTLDAAKAQATKDMLSGVSSYVSVEVASDFEAQQMEQTKNGRTDEETEIRSTVRSHSAAAVEGVKPDEIYWEKVQASPLLPDNVSYRCFVHARVPKAEITRARLKKQLDRQTKSGRRMVVVLPFRPALASAELSALADAFAEELSRRLARAPSLYVSDPGLVRGLLTGDRLASEADALEAVRDALLPDFVIGGSYQLFRDRLRVSFTIYGADGTGVIAGDTVERAYSELFALEDSLIAAIEKELGTKGALGANAEPLPANRAPAVKDAAAPAREAFEAYHQASELFQAGKNEPALAKLAHAIELRPDYGEAYVRMGHVLDRLGRYGRALPAGILSGGSDLSYRSPMIELCTSWADVTTDPPAVFLAAGEGAIAGASPVPEGEDVDEVLSAVRFIRSGGYVPNPDVPRLPRSATGAYWHAYRIALASADERLERESLLALADLAQRTDRREDARLLYQGVLEAAVKSADLNLESLALYGLGRVLKDRSDFLNAFETLKQALEKRLLMMEKPYLLEILNELGGLSVSLARYRLARAFYEKALKIAEDLDNDYFRAVLGNNLGVLEFMAGHSSRAEEYFQRAWLYLTDLDEAEGRISSGLNISLLGYSRGDPERARAYLKEAKRIVEATGLESRRAQLQQHQGMQALLAGSSAEALRSLLRSWALYHRLGRPLDELRLRSGVIAAELHWLAERSRADGGVHQAEAWPISCLQDKAHQVLVQGWGGDGTTLGARIAERYYLASRSYRGYYGQPYPYHAEPQLMSFLLQGESETQLYAILSAELVARLK